MKLLRFKMFESDSSAITTVKPERREGRFGGTDDTLYFYIGEEKIGFLTLGSNKGDEYLCIIKIQLKDKFRGKGYGPHLLDEGVKYAKYIGFKGIVSQGGIYRNHHAEGMWSRIKDKRVVQAENGKDLDYYLD